MDGSERTADKSTQTNFRPFGPFRDRFRSDTSVFSTISNFSNFSFRGKDKRRSNFNLDSVEGGGGDDGKIGGCTYDEVEEFV